MTRQQSLLVLIMITADQSQTFKDTPVQSDTQCVEKKNLVAMSNNHSPTSC